MYINYLHFNEIDSTHSYALNHLAECNPSHWTAISAGTQRSGKGQGQKSWQDIPGKAVLLTLVSPQISLEAEAVFPHHMAAAVAALEALQPFAHTRLQLKWPNDLYRDGQKLGGLLTDAQWAGDRCKRLVFSIGVNALEAPEGFAALDRVPPLEEVRSILAEALVRAWTEEPLKAHDSYVKHWMHAGMGRWKRAGEEEVFQAHAVGVDAFGRIGLQPLEADGPSWYLHGQVQWVG